MLRCFDFMWRLDCSAIVDTLRTCVVNDAGDPLHVHHNLPTTERLSGPVTDPMNDACAEE